MTVVWVSSLDSESSDSDYDSGMESDGFDLSDLGDSNYELCQVGNSTISIPVEIFDFENLSSILNTDTWNDILNEKEKYQLCCFLPDMNLETFSTTLSQLFSGENFHFCNPLDDFFMRMKSGLFNPRVVLTRNGLNVFKKKEYYHSLITYQNNMVSDFVKVKDAWENCFGSGMEEKLCVLNTLKNQRCLKYDFTQSYNNIDNSSHILAQNRCEEADEYDNRVDNTASLMKIRKKKEVLSYPKYKSKRRVHDQVVNVGKYHSNANGHGKYTSNGGNVATPCYSDDETESDSEGGDGAVNPYQKKLNDPMKVAKFVNMDMEFRGKYKSKLTAAKSMEDIVLVKKTSLLNSSAKVMSYVNDKKRKGVIGTDSTLNRMNDCGTSAPIPDLHGKTNLPMLACNSITKKQKGSFIYPKQEVLQIDGPSFMKKKAKKKADSLDVSSTVPDSMNLEKEILDIKPEPKPQKKPFTPITPTEHTGFSFSIICLLTAVRKAMLTPKGEGDIKGDVQQKAVEEDSKAQVMNQVALESNKTQAINPSDSELTKVQTIFPRDSELNKAQIMNPSDSEVNKSQSMNPSASEPENEKTLPSLIVQEIADKVRANPGDRCILETGEPLNELVRGVLKLFSLKTAPLGAKDWKALVSYEKSNKSWAWVGPTPLNMFDSKRFNEEETSPEAWGLPYKTLVKLVDSFANWYKHGQEIHKQIESLPPLPTTFLPQLDDKERFRDLRTLKSLNTIKPSSEEVKKYFRCEELIRYAIPDRAFSYTTADGKKCIVAPLRKGGKATTKVREHFILKPNRSPHITILCIVRDAAARLPGGVGTRADVCTLVRDSQFVVEDVTDEQLSPIVSGALDRLHYERDPCVSFDGERKLWVYLHIDREEEDFDEDGTSSTKKWKRPRKDAAEQTETVAGNDTSNPTTVDRTTSGYDLNADVNANVSYNKETDVLLVNSDMTTNADETIQSFLNISSAGTDQGNALSCSPVVGLTPMQENQGVSQDNPAIDVFNNEAFGRETQAGLLDVSFL